MKEEERIMEKDKETITVVFRDEAMSKVRSKMMVRKFSPTCSNLGLGTLHLGSDIAPAGAKPFVAFEGDKKVVIFGTPIIIPRSV